MTDGQVPPRKGGWDAASRIIPILAGLALAGEHLVDLSRLKSTTMGALGLLLTPIYFGAGWLIGLAVFMCLSLAGWGSTETAEKAVGRKSWFYWPLVIVAFLFLIFAMGG